MKIDRSGGLINEPEIESEESRNKREDLHQAATKI